MSNDIDLETGEIRFFHRHPFSRERVQTQIIGESLTHQSHHDGCDVNQIMARYNRTGEMPDGRPGQFADVSNLQGDLTTLVEKARETSKEVKRRSRKKEEQNDLPGLDNPVNQPTPSASVETPPPAPAPAPATPPA